MANLLKTFLWGNSIALAWLWGIGLFFTVQIAIQFGLNGLLLYSITNAGGLALFGIINHFIARKYSSSEAFEQGFLQKASKFKFAFFTYQFLAITLTLFVCFKYVSLPLGVLSILVAIMFIGAVIFLGEEFDIRYIKYSHALAGIILASALYVLLDSGYLLPRGVLGAFSTPEFYTPIVNFAKPKAIEYSFWIPIAVGFLFGPWLDLQHWQRAIQIHKEGLSIAGSYTIAGLLFWCIIFSNGLIALSCFNLNRESIMALPNLHLGNTGLLYQVKDTITQVLNSNPDYHYLLAAYVVFVAIGALTTFDSGYIATKWYLNALVKDSKNIVLSFIPKNFVISPIPWFFLCIVVATVSMHFSQLGKFIARFDPSLEKFFRIELEYYVAFFASFFIMYAVTFIRSIADPQHDQGFSVLKLFSTGLFSISIFGIGYFSENPLVMAIGSLVPVIYGIFTVDLLRNITSVVAKSELVSSSPVITSAGSQNQVMAPNPNYKLPANAESVSVSGCYKIDEWFVHSFIPTYQDTNSVGNVYFAMYAMWVGKTRELFFLECLSDFDPKTSPYLILTRSFEHKFLRETREFEPVTIHLRISDFNRKFVTLEHKIQDEAGNMIGKGKQVLMFVSSVDYSLIDIPQSVYAAFIPWAGHALEAKA